VSSVYILLDALPTADSSAFQYKTPSYLSTDRAVDAIHSMMLDDRRISPKNTLAIRMPRRVRYIIQVILDMRKLSVK
jgi:hypothetical protein